MALIPTSDLTTLQSASAVKTVAQSAQEDTQEMAVAYAINTAANTGEMETVFQGVLFESIKTKLETEGYTLTNYGAANPDFRTVISWK